MFGSFLPLPVATMRASDLQITADTYPAKESAKFAVRTLRPVLKWAAKRNYLPKELADLQAGQPKKRKRVLSRAELAAVLPHLTTDDPHRLALRFMLLTLARLDEVCGATWQEIDLDQGTWTIPAERIKNESEHIIDLSLSHPLILTLQ